MCTLHIMAPLPLRSSSTDYPLARNSHMLHLPIYSFVFSIDFDCNTLHIFFNGNVYSDTIDWNHLASKRFNLMTLELHFLKSVIE